ncbi:hypothetical protein ABEY64_05760 [Bacillus mycoides]
MGTYTKGPKPFTQCDRQYFLTNLEKYCRIIKESFNLYRIQNTTRRWIYGEQNSRRSC